MLKENIKVGWLFSETGSYGALGRSMRAGATLAVDEINANPTYDFQIEPVLVDPGGETARYADAARELMSNYGTTHICGCYTSASRKEILPVVEKRDALLWYPSHYEGFETNDNIIYTGASPNQHIIPLSRYLIEHHGARGWFVGSNYVWAWENNRILREALISAGGLVFGERYFPVGDVDFGNLPETIIENSPDFVFVTLIGNSCYRFIKRLREAAAKAGVDQPATMPVASCSLSEAELPFLGDEADGHLCSSVYFSTVDTPENHTFTTRWNAFYADQGEASADAEATYIAMHLLAQAIHRSGSIELDEVREAVTKLEFRAPQGQLRVDSDNLHCEMRPRIGRSNVNGRFDIIQEAHTPVRPDPYLVWTECLDRPKTGLRIAQ
ncbi:transporter substrate-binding domain-containing protein [Spiribacter insolitus]|uniref:Transporter substrate-binding domain-containing protein n=1 Tax=Spiribacter insolitus TaxID=3122417 RepID=A0ABV3T4U0_9GAMM